MNFLLASVFERFLMDYPFFKIYFTLITKIRARLFNLEKQWKPACKDKGKILYDNQGVCSSNFLLIKFFFFKFYQFLVKKIHSEKNSFCSEKYYFGPFGNFYLVLNVRWEENCPWWLFIHPCLSININM